MGGYIGSKASVTQVDGYNRSEADAEFVQVSGDTMTGDLSFGDNDKAIFGSGSDLQIYHSGAQSVIADVGTGQLTLSTNGTDIRLADSSGNRMLIAKPSAEVELYHNGSPKLATTNAGVDVTGTITATSFSGDGSALTGVGGSTTYGAVGTYMFARRTAAGQSITSNTTIAGSGLRPTGIVNLRLGISTEIRNSRRDQATLSGTWRAMGDAERYTTSSLYTVGTLLVRIS